MHFRRHYDAIEIIRQQGTTYSGLEYDYVGRAGRNQEYS